MADVAAVLPYVYFSLVYSGGHHEVFCNKEIHMTLFGDGYGSAPISNEKLSFRVHENGCDCEKYK